jgi:hypothetical protein
VLADWAKREAAATPTSKNAKASFWIWRPLIWVKLSQGERGWESAFLYFAIGLE